MTEHVVTQNIKQSGTRISGELVCSCGISASVTHNKKTSLTVARARLRKLHEAKPKTKPKKVKKQKPIEDPTIQESEDAWDESSNIEPELEPNEGDNEGGANS